MRPFFIGLSITLGYSINPLVMAQNAGPEIQNSIHNFSFKKEDIESLIKLLEVREFIESEQATDALLRLQGLTEDEIKHMTMDSMQNVKEEALLSTNTSFSEEDSLLINTSFDFEVSNEVTEDNFLTKATTSKIKKYQ